MKKEFYLQILKWSFAVMAVSMVSCKEITTPPPPIKDEAESIYVADYKSVGYMTYTGKLYSINAISGAKQWEYPIGYDPKGSLEVDNGMIYVCGPHILEAIDAKTGVKKWDRKTPDEFEYYDYVTVLNKVAYLVNGGALWALDAVSGAEKWSLRTNFILTPPIAADGVVYFGNLDRKFYAIDATTGKEKWSIPLNFSADCKPAYSKGAVFVSSADKKFVALDATTGIVKWTFESDNTLESTPTIVDGVVYFGARGGGFNNYLYAVDATTGKEKWKAATERSSMKYPFAFNGSIYGGYWDLMAFGAEAGKQKWVFEPDGSLSSYNAPVAVDDIVYVSCSSSSASIYAIDATTGVKKWKFIADNQQNLSAPTVITKLGKVILPTISGAKQ